MKKYLLMAVTLTGLALFSCSNDSDEPSTVPQNTNPPARTAIADPVFEQELVDLGIDDEVDGSVLDSNASTVTSLVMNDKGISSLDGISAFTDLENLWVNDNQISTLDLSRNTALKFVFAGNNGLTDVNVRTLLILEKLSVPGNNITELDVSNNTALQTLNLRDNSLGAIDISSVPNSIQLNIFSVENNPLTCIQVNENLLDNIPSQWTKDEEDTYSLNCN